MEITRRIVGEFERAVRRYPAQWYVFRDMWSGDSQPPPGR